MAPASTVLSLVVVLQIPTLMVIFGAVFLKAPPKNVNILYGYRTKRSMASQEAWDYSHILTGKLWLVLGTGLLLGLIPLYFGGFVNSAFDSLFYMVFEIAVMIVPVIYVEHKLKEKFENLY